MLSIIICVAIGLGLFIGYHKGLVRQLGSMVAVFVALIVSRLLGESLTEAVAKLLGHNAESAIPRMVDSFLAHVMLFLIVWIGVWFLARAIHEVIKAVKLSCLNSLAGALFMAFKVAIVMSIIVNIWVLAGNDAADPDKGGPIVEATAWFIPALLGYLQCNF